MPLIYALVSKFSTIWQAEDSPLIVALWTSGSVDWNSFPISGDIVAYFSFDVSTTSDDNQVALMRTPESPMMTQLTLVDLESLKSEAIGMAPKNKVPELILTGIDVLILAMITARKIRTRSNHNRRTPSDAQVRRSCP